MEGKMRRGQEIISALNSQLSMLDSILLAIAFPPLNFGNIRESACPGVGGAIS